MLKTSPWVAKASELQRPVTTSWDMPGLRGGHPGGRAGARAGCVREGRGLWPEESGAQLGEPRGRAPPLGSGVWRRVPSTPWVCACGRGGGEAPCEWQVYTNTTASTANML